MSRTSRRRTRRVSSAEFKAKVALAALREGKTLACPGLFESKVFRGNGSLNLRISVEASEVNRRADCSDIAGGRPGTSC